MGPIVSTKMPPWAALHCLVRRLAAALAMALVIGASPAHAQATETGVSNAWILTPLSLVNASDMDFGNIVQPTTAGTVVLSAGPTPTCTVTGGVTVRFGNCTAARFAGWGAPNQQIRIQMPNFPITISNGAQTMQITNRTIDVTPDLVLTNGNPNANGNVRYRIISASGVFDFRFGGTLHVAANQALGLYTGTFSVTVTYN